MPGKKDDVWACADTHVERLVEKKLQPNCKSKPSFSS